MISKIFIAGHKGMVGSALMRRVSKHTDAEIVTATKAEIDLRNNNAVIHFLQQQKPDTVIIAAAKVGGILYNSTHPADFLYDNLAIAKNLIDSSHLCDVQRVLFLGSSCIYPKLCPQPIKEEYLMSGPLEPTNEAYAISKIAGLKMCSSYRKQYGRVYHSVMPTNLYGINDNYHPDHSHVIPGLIRRFHEAKIQNSPTVSMWGSGTPRREFLFADDLADACYHLLNLSDPPDWVNVGCGQDMSILEIAEQIKEVVGYRGEIVLDVSKPDGTPRKLLDTSIINSLGWSPRVGLNEGLQIAYADFLTK